MREGCGWHTDAGRQHLLRQRLHYPSEAHVEPAAATLDAGTKSASSRIRPAFPDNLPRIFIDGATIHVNGVFRHGFLLAPVLAALVADFLETGRREPEVLFSAPEPALRHM